MTSALRGSRAGAWVPGQRASNLSAPVNPEVRVVGIRFRGKVTVQEIVGQKDGIAVVRPAVVDDFLQPSNIQAVIVMPGVLCGLVPEQGFFVWLKDNRLSGQVLTWIAVLEYGATRPHSACPVHP